MGLHPLEVMFSHGAVEMEADTKYVMELVMVYTDRTVDMETVWVVEVRRGWLEMTAMPLCSDSSNINNKGSLHQ